MIQYFTFFAKNMSNLTTYPDCCFTSHHDKCAGKCYYDDLGCLLICYTCTKLLIPCNWIVCISATLLCPCMMGEL